jgi:Domain of unknown function (DUF4279)
VQNYQFSVRLRIWHPNIDPEFISRQLDMQPCRSAKVGQPRATPNGTVLGGTYPHSYWCADPFNYGEYSSTDEAMEDVLASILEQLQPKKEFFSKLITEGGRLVLCISSFSARNYTLEVPPALMLQCADLGFTLAHDVFPVMQSS